MNVLYVFATLPVGGAEEHLKTLLLNLDTSRIKPTVCCIGEKGAIGEEIESLGFEVVGLSRMKTKKWDLVAVRRIASLIKERDIDLVHTQLYHGNMYGRVAALMAGVPFIASEQNVSIDYKFKRKVINRLLAKRSERIIAVSGAVKDHIVERDGIDADSVDVIYNSIDPDKLKTKLSVREAKERLGLPTDVPVIGAICRLAKQKGHTYLLRAFKELKRTHTGAVLLIVGSGPTEGEIRAEISELNIGENVRLLGQRRDVAEILRALDLYVLPSLWEGFPMALLEAMATGLPVVATSVGGVPEVIEDRVTGRVVESEDVAALTEVMLDTLDDPEAAALQGERGAAVVRERFSAPVMTKQITELYEEVLGSNE